MPTSRLTDILHVKHAAFFIAVLTTSLAMESRSAEVIPGTSDRYFNEYAGVVSEEARYRFNQKLAQFERETSDQVVVAVFPKMQSDSDIADYTQRVAQAGGVSQNDGRGEQQGTGRTLNQNPNDNPKHNPNDNPKHNPNDNQNPNPNDNLKHDPNPVRPSPWFFILFGIPLIVIVIVVSMIRLRRRRSDDEQQPVQPRRFEERNGRKFPSYYPLRIAIEFKSGGAKPPQQLDGWQASLKGTAKQLTPLRLLPLFESEDSNLLSQLLDRARRNDPDYEPPDLSAWFQVETPAGVNADELVKRLRKLDNIETAYVIRPNPPPGGREENPRYKRQGYLEAAPKGIDARYAWGFLGGDGAGIGFVDLEQGWNLNHRDLKDAQITLISGVSWYEYDHGTSVLGEVLMVDNTIGGIGIAPSAKGRVISLWRTESSPNTAAAIRHAAASMSFGDVLLLEVQEIDPVNDTNYWPAEILDVNYHEIRRATAAGIVVVEAAGNGGHDLDNYINAKSRPIFDRSIRDSGAIMVSAGSSVDRHRLAYMNHGKRIDCYAWGENIVTTTTNDAGESNTEYRTDFGSTSGASAIVAGAALIVQGIAQAVLGRRFSPRELRALLTANGTLSKTPATDKIGVMPNLLAIITNNQLNVAPVPTPPP